MEIGVLRDGVLEWFLHGFGSKFNDFDFHVLDYDLPYFCLNGSLQLHFYTLMFS